MFIVTTVHDTIRVPPPLLSLPTLQAIHMEIDNKYPNRVLLDVGLVISRYGDCIQVQHGACVAGDGGSHYACQFRLLVFCPFHEEVCLGRISKQTASGVHVTLGFFEDVFIPAYWMLNPSKYDNESGMWVWTPQFDDEDDLDDKEGDEKIVPSTESTVETAAMLTAIKTEDAVETTSDLQADPSQSQNVNTYEIVVGAEIRFRVKSIQYTQITNTAKGVQATTTSAEQGRKRSSSVGQLDEGYSGTNHNSTAFPPAMKIIASICEDGLGLTSWWSGAEEAEHFEVGAAVHEDLEDIKFPVQTKTEENGER